ncbi:helix-turn-helix transcriptional regulator [Leuconostoc mesenteroides]|uniref:helix-turn-helix domain-containing protein n=1 Tax=Leuconostoc mesenteroides TaxID=1245 RepID=UPI001CBAFBDD|nr:helix-turn-helix transcriptional regulator [Leuconostoc mesenteroides]MBZ1515958.1 helix-turn-helix transcriptional regulator [Leuconostoc mesenteroides]
MDRLRELINERNRVLLSRKRYNDRQKLMTPLSFYMRLFDISLSDLACLSSVSLNKIRQIEEGVYKPNDIELIALSNAITVPKKYICDRLFSGMNVKNHEKFLKLNREYCLEKDNTSRLKKIRKNKGLTRTELSDKTKISMSMIESIETGRREAGVKTLIKLADYFNVSIDYLVGRSDVR